MVKLNTTTHTPGPWKIIEFPGYMNRYEVETPFGYTAVICGHDEESQANARVMAAAPELLEVCRKLVNTGFCPSCGCDLANSPGCPYCVVMTLARKAVGKAEGR